MFPTLFLIMKIRREMALPGSQFPLGKGMEGRKSDLFLLLPDAFVCFIFDDDLESVLLNLPQNAWQMDVTHKLNRHSNKQQDPLTFKIAPKIFFSA